VEGGTAGGSRWQRVAAGGSGWQRVAAGGSGWQRVAAGGSGWQRVAAGGMVCGMGWQRVACGACVRLASAQVPGETTWAYRTARRSVSRTDGRYGCWHFLTNLPPVPPHEASRLHAAHRLPAAERTPPRRPLAPGLPPGLRAIAPSCASAKRPAARTGDNTGPRGGPDSPAPAWGTRSAGAAGAGKGTTAAAAGDHDDGGRAAWGKAPARVRWSTRGSSSSVGTAATATPVRASASRPACRRWARASRFRSMWAVNGVPVGGVLATGGGQTCAAAAARSRSTSCCSAAARWV
jgi:hypothetical protein